MTTEDTMQKTRPDLETQAWNCDKWPKWLDDLVEETNMVADRTDMSSEQAHAYAILRAIEAERAERERLEAKVTELGAENSRLNFALFYTDFATVGLREPDDGYSVCIGVNREKMEAAKRLRDRGLATITDSAQGPLVSRAAVNGAPRP